MINEPFFFLRDVTEMLPKLTVISMYIYIIHKYMFLNMCQVILICYYPIVLIIFTKKKKIYKITPKLKVKSNTIEILNSITVIIIS